MDLFDIPTMTEGDCHIFNTVEFPQANDLNKVYRVAECVAAGSTTPEEIADLLDVVAREGAYYGAAACALRLVRKRESAAGAFYETTVFGSDWVAADGEDRKRLMLERTLDAPHVKFVASSLGEALPLSLPLPPSLFDSTRIEAAIDSLPDLGSATRHRRASTIASWMRMVASL